MRDLLLELLPHAPQFGLHVHPHIPADKLRNALRDYGKGVHPEEVLALYDATLMGSAKDGALFTSDGFLFQNNNLEAVQQIKYADLVSVEDKKKLMGGRKVKVEVNRGRATFELIMDFSGKPEAAGYVSHFLKEALLRGATAEMVDRRSDETVNREAVVEALQALVHDGVLSRAAMQRMLDAL